MQWRSPVGVAMLFATNGAAFASILPWYPTFARQWELSEAVFGIVVACFAAGALVASALPSLLVNRFGPIPVFTAGTVALSVLVAAVGWTSSAVGLALCLLGIGMLDAIVDVGQNVTAVRVQVNQKITIISSMHAFWSLGSVVGAAVATLATASGIDPRWHLGAVALIISLVALFGARLIDAPPLPQTPGGRASLSWRVLLPVLPLALLATSGTVVEDVANNWSSLAAVELAGADVGTAGMAFTILLAAQCVGRFTGDPLIHRFGRMRIAQLGGALILLGGILVVAAQGWPLFAAGLVGVGFGCATLVPSAYAVAAQLPGVSEGAGVTLLSWLMRVGFLATSPVIGLLATATSLRTALWLLVACGVLALAAAPSLKAGLVEKQL